LSEVYRRGSCFVSTAMHDSIMSLFNDSKQGWPRMKKIFFAGLSLFLILFFHTVFGQEIKTGTISGQLMTKGGSPLSGGQAFFFNNASGPPPSADKYWRIPDYVTRIDEQGKFSLNLPEGTYYLGAIKRISGEKIGPPKEGDYFFASMDDKGLPKSYLVKRGMKNDIGTISEAIPFQKSVSKPGTEITAVEGTILDTEGNPVVGALVFAYTSPTMVGKPLFASERTGKDGHYTLRVYDNGNYYLRVRSVYGGGPPAIGEIIGFYGEKEPIAVSTRKGEKMQGVNILVRRFYGKKTMMPMK